MLFRGSSDILNDFFNAFIFIISALLLLSLVVTPVKASQLIPVNRLHFYSIDGTKFGGSQSNLNCDLTILPQLKHQPRNCILLHLQEASVVLLEDFFYKKVAGIVVILPPGAYYKQEAAILREIEDYLMSRSVPFPVTFVKDSPEVKKLVQQVTENSYQVAKNKLLYSLIGASYRAEVYTDNSYSTYTNQTKGASKNYYDRAIKKESIKLTNLHGFLRPFDPVKKTVLITAPYDTFSFIENSASGYESNASGSVLMLELMRVLSTLFSNQEYQMKYNLLFLFTDGGKYNFYGFEKWISSKLKNAEETILIDSIVQSISLEALIRPHTGNLYLHFSKPPQKDSFSQQIVDLFQMAAKIHAKDVQVQVVHKKVKLNKDFLDWEHERMSVHRITGFTLSSWPSVDQVYLRHSSLDGINIEDKTLQTEAVFLARNMRIIAEVLARAVTNATLDKQFELDKRPIISEKWVQPESMASLMKWIMSQPRETHTLKYVEPSNDPTRPQINSAKIVNSLMDHMKSSLVGVKAESFRWYEVVEKPRRTKNIKNIVEEDNSALNPLDRLKKPMNVDFNLPTDQLILKIFKLQTSVFDLIISACILGYLFVLHNLLIRIIPLSNRLLAPQKEKAL